jgi:glyoxylase-like metal-dependent hydrolase (beta-lactamase superfamily II)
MKIKYYWYNAFIIQNDKVKIAIDPGQNLYLFSLGSLIPKSEWSSITHILVTHGDPDHHYQTDRVAEASGAPVICGKDSFCLRAIAEAGCCMTPLLKRFIRWILARQLI